MSDQSQETPEASTDASVLAVGALRFAGLLGALAIIIGSFTAHGLQEWLINQGHQYVVGKRLSQAEVGVRYHLFHVIAIVALAGVSHRFSPKTFSIILTLMISGIVLFSGSLYLLVMLNLPVLGAITPLGGLAWIVAWILLVFAKKP